VQAAAAGNPGKAANGQERVSGFFLEVERASKSSQVLRSKLQRYAKLVSQGLYQSLFGTRSLRLLFVFAGEFRTDQTRLPLRAAHEARALGIAFSRSAALDTLTSAHPASILIEPLWLAPDGGDPTSLFRTVSR
jgi:hypothetical protein